MPSLVCRSTGPDGKLRLCYGHLKRGAVEQFERIATVGEVVGEQADVHVAQDGLGSVRRSCGGLNALARARVASEAREHW